jgi:hypothetical protein
MSHNRALNNGTFFNDEMALGLLSNNATTSPPINEIKLDNTFECPELPQMTYLS